MHATQQARDTYWQIRKIGNRHHVAEAWCRDGKTTAIHHPLHQVIAGDLTELRSELVAKGLRPCDVHAADAGIIEVWCNHREVNGSPD